MICTLFTLKNKGIAASIVQPTSTAFIVFLFININEAKNNEKHNINGKKNRYCGDDKIRVPYLKQQCRI